MTNAQWHYQTNQDLRIHALEKQLKRKKAQTYRDLVKMRHEWTAVFEELEEALQKKIREHDAVIEEKDRVIEELKEKTAALCVQLKEQIELRYTAQAEAEALDEKCIWSR